jgi:hypothetical protein
VFTSIRKKGLSQINWKTPVIFSNSNVNKLPSGEEKGIIKWLQRTDKHVVEYEC